MDCDDACDGNDDGGLGLADAITILESLYGGSGPLPAPSGACGPAATTDGQGCDNFPICP